LYLNETKVDSDELPSNGDWALFDKITEVVVGESTAAVDQQQVQQTNWRSRNRGSSSTAGRAGVADSSVGRFTGCIRDVVVDDE
jgi:hypothetical protein